MLRFVVLAVMTLCVGVPKGGHAQDVASPGSRDAEARHLFSAGRLAYDEGRFEDALQNYQRSYELSGRPELLFNIGMAADRLREDGKALEAFRAYLNAVPDAPNRARVEERIRVLERTQASVLPAPSPEPEPASPAVEIVVAKPSPPSSPSDRPSLASRWWFWTAIGVGVAAVAVTAVVIASRPESTTLESGDVGGIIFTLGGR